MRTGRSEGQDISSSDSQEYWRRKEVFKDQRKDSQSRSLQVLLVQIFFGRGD
jgi:hypothetical protein